MKLTTSLNGQAMGPQSLLAPPWTRVRRVQLIRREVREYLPGSAIELLLSEGDTVVEGGEDLGSRVAAAGDPPPTIYATLMVTADLASLGSRFRDPADAATAVRVVELLEDHPELPERIAGRMRPELARLCGADEVTEWAVSVEASVRAEGTAIFIDADIVAVPPRTEVG